MNEILKKLKELPADQLDKLIKEASNIREKRSPPIQVEFPVANVTKPILEPAYRLSLDRFSGRTLMCLRHPGMGWIHFIFRANERDRIIEIMTNHRKNFKSPQK